MYIYIMYYCILLTNFELPSCLSNESLYETLRDKHNIAFLYRYLCFYADLAARLLVYFSCDTSKLFIFKHLTRPARTHVSLVSDVQTNIDTYILYASLTCQMSNVSRLQGDLACFYGVLHTHR